MTWQWVLNQIFAFIGLIFVIISFQQKDSKKLLLFKNFATLFVFIGLCFLGNVSAIILCGAGIVRNLVTFYFACKKNPKKSLKYISSILLIILVTTLNLIYWNGYFSLLSIVIGVLTVITFMQPKASTIRKLSIITRTLLIVYYVLLLSPVNILIGIVGLTSVIVGIARLDIKHSRRGHKI